MQSADVPNGVPHLIRPCRREDLSANRSHSFPETSKHSGQEQEASARRPFSN